MSLGGSEPHNAATNAAGPPTTIALLKSYDPLKECGIVIVFTNITFARATAMLRSQCVDGKVY